METKAKEDVLLRARYTVGDVDFEAELREQFLSYDTDRNGVLCKAEVGNAMRKLGIPPQSLSGIHMRPRRVYACGCGWVCECMYGYVYV